MTASDPNIESVEPLEGLRGRLAASSPAAIVLWIIAGGTLVRLFVATLVGLDMDGTYSAVMARTPSLSYFDHAPIHYWLIWLSTHLFGSEAPWVVRLPFILLFAGSNWLMFKLGERVHGAAAGLWAVLALNLCGVFTFAFSWFVVPDGPLVFFLLLATLLFSRIVFDGSLSVGEALPHWIAAGAAGGAAMLSKYTGVFFFAGAGLFLLTDPRLRRQLLSVNPWLGSLVGFVVFSPVLIWNAQHHWISFLFQGERATLDRTGGLYHVWASVLGQLGYLAPWFGIWMAYVLVKSAWRGPADRRRWFFVCLAIGPIIVFTLLNALQQGIPHWTMPGWLMVVPLLGIEVTEMSMRMRRRLAQLAIAGLAIVAVGFAALAVQVRTGVLSRAILAVVPIPKLARHDPFADLIDWTPIRTELERRGVLPSTDFVGGLFGIATTKVGYGFGPSYRLLCLCHPRELHHHRFVQDEQAMAGANGVIVVHADEEPIVASYIRDHFERTEPPLHITIERGGVPVLNFSAFRGFGFRPGP